MRTVASRVWTFTVLITAVSGNLSAGTFVNPSQVPDTPSGLSWSAVATGTALPIRTSGTAAGQPGAVVYVNLTTGQIQFDPKGWSVATFILTYTTGTVNVGAATPGPFQYTTGTGEFSYSDIVGTERTFPAKSAISSGLTPTTYPSRVGLTIGPPLSANLNVGTNPNSASTNGFWNLGWAFPSDLIASGSLTSLDFRNFRTIGQGSNLNANVLGYGSQQCVFQYTVNGITGTQVGAVIPTPEPALTFMAVVGLACAGFATRWRRLAVTGRRNEVTTPYYIAFAAVVCIITEPTFAATYDPPSTTSLTNRISGTTPSGLNWERIASGTALPLTNGLPGALAYLNVSTGQIQFDSNGLGVSSLNFTYTSGSISPSGTAPGPVTVSAGGTRTWSPYAGATFTIYPSRITSVFPFLADKPFSFPGDLFVSGSSVLVENFKFFGGFEQCQRECARLW